MAKILPILMNGEMVRAIRKDLKAQTRRLIPWKYVSLADTDRNDPSYFYVEDDAANWWSGVDLAPYQVGDILYVRETFAVDTEKACILGNGEPYEPEVIKYRADGSKLRDSVWTPSIHMPKWAARLFLRVTNVRVQQLQNISQTDAAAEGLPREFDEELLGFGEKVWKFFAPDGSEHGDPRCAFMRLWDSLAKPGTKFDDNPWVWVYEFEKCDKPEGFPNA